MGHKLVACSHKAADHLQQGGRAAATAVAEGAVQPDRSADLTDTGAGEASSRKERASVGESSAEKAAGDVLALPMRDVGRPEGFQVGAAEIQVTKETVQVEAEEVQVAEEEVQAAEEEVETAQEKVQIMADQLIGQNGQGISAFCPEAALTPTLLRNVHLGHYLIR